MKRLTCNIKVGEHQFNFVSDVEISSSYETYTDTCSIKIPSKIQFEGKSIIQGNNNTIFKAGDKVTVDLGYDFQNQTVFTGYLTKVSTTTPLILHCEDAMYLFKKATYTKSFKSVSLKELVNFLVSGIKEPIKANVTMDVQLGKFMIENNATGVQVFEELKKTYGISSFIRGGELFVGMSYNSDTANYSKEKEFIFQQQVIDDSLEYQNKDERKVKIHAVSIDKNNKKMEYSTGDADGEKVDIFGYDLSSGDLKKLAEEALNKHRVDTLEGDFTTFGNPLVRHGDKAKLNDLKYPERNGVYIVKQVSTTFGTGGYRQRISLGKKLSN